MVNLCFYLEILIPVSKLPLALQQGDIDPVKAIDALVTIKEKLVNLKEKSIDDYPTLSTIKRKSPRSGDDFVYQDVTLKNMEGELTKIRKKQGREITAIEDIIHARLDEETIFLKPIGRILNCEAWGGDEDEIEEDIGFADRAVKKIYNHFQKPLENAGVCKTESEYLDEWHDLVRYVRTYLYPSKSAYLKTWRRIFDSSRADSDFKNVLLLP